MDKTERKDSADNQELATEMAVRRHNTQHAAHNTRGEQNKDSQNTSNKRPEGPGVGSMRFFRERWGRWFRFSLEGRLLSSADSWRSLGQPAELQVGSVKVGVAQN